MKGSERIELSLSRRAKLFYIAAALFFLVAGLWNASNEGNEIPLATSIPIFAALLMGFLLWRKGRGGAGEITLDDQGIVIGTGIAIGRVTWDNFERASVFRWWTRLFLGIAVVDPQRFLDSRAALSSRRKLEVNLLSLGNHAAMLAPPHGLAAVLGLLGIKAIPKSGSEMEMLAYNRANMGYDICIPLLGVANGADIPARIEARRRLGVAPLAATFGATATGPAEDHKTCPMCAEPVRAAARICRFCGHKFDDAAAKPG